MSTLSLHALDREIIEGRYRIVYRIRAKGITKEPTCSAGVNLVRPAQR